MYEKHIKVAPKSLSVDYVLRKDPSPHLKLGGLLYDLLPLVGHDSTDPLESRLVQRSHFSLAATMCLGSITPGFASGGYFGRLKK